MEQKAFPQLVKAGVEQLVKAILEQLVKAKASLEQLVDKQGELKLDTMCQIISSPLCCCMHTYSQHYCPPFFVINNILSLLRPL